MKREAILPGHPPEPWVYDYQEIGGPRGYETVSSRARAALAKVRP